MANCKKSAIFVVVIIVLTHFTIPSFSQDKPSPYITNMIVTRLIMQKFSKINTREIKDIKLTKEFMSKNGRYCIEVSYNRISNTGRICPEKGKFFIEKKGNIWLGGKNGGAP